MLEVTVLSVCCSQLQLHLSTGVSSMLYGALYWSRVELLKTQTSQIRRLKDTDRRETILEEESYESC